MANESSVHIKKEKEREIRHPSDDPTYKERVYKGQVRIANGDLKFHNEGDRQEYEKRVASNPNNVPGLPAFFPPLQIKQLPVVNAAKRCTNIVTELTESGMGIEERECGGCCIKADNFICPRCQKDNS
jgi:hypothetical protein